MGRRPEDAYDWALGLREVQKDVADTFEAELETSRNLWANQG